MNKVYLAFKRFMDIVISFIGIIFLFGPLVYPIILIIQIFETKGHPIFKQKRIGRNKKIFLILKFRTMICSAPSETASEELLDPSQYYTRFGTLLRKTHLDELPQIFNIFIGQMSFVGPRPALWNQYELIEKRDIVNVNSVRPGLTGYAQIDTSHVLSIDEKTNKDKYYLDHISFALDVKIFFGTIKTVFKSRKKTNA